MKLTKTIVSWGLAEGNVVVVLDRQAVKAGATLRREGHD